MEHKIEIVVSDDGNISLNSDMGPEALVFNLEAAKKMVLDEALAPGKVSNDI